MTTQKVPVEAPNARSAFERWLARGDAIGVFTNHDLGSRDVGRAVFIPLDADEVRRLPIGKAHAPDSSTYGLGWRYLLDRVETSLDAFDFVGGGA